MMVFLALLLLLALAAPAAAAPGSGPAAAVSLGDSYISGEAGRWAGNSIDPTHGNSGTDRGRGAYSDTNGCHRADVAEIMSAPIGGLERINLACSGGQTKNIWRAASGGTGQNGEAPQGDQLLEVARAKDVKLVVMSIGGNDLGFAGIVAACLQAYVAQTGPCRDGQQQAIDSKLPQATANVIKAIDEVRAVMATAGYRVTDYRFVLQTYPSVIPRSSEMRYATPPEREAHGCPFYDQDLDWARDQAAPAIGGMVKRAAAERDVEVMDLIDAFQGHEFCSKSTQEATPLAPVTPQNGDWGRFVGASTVQQGDLQEAFHPNAFGHSAFGACLAKVFAATRGTFACAGRAGIEPSGVTVTRTGTFSTRTVRASAPRLRLAVRRPSRRCVSVRVKAAGRPVAGARIRFAGRRKVTDRRGRRSFCRRLKPGRYRVAASRTGYRSATRSVRMRS